jgi:lipoprotein NlpD
LQWRKEIRTGPGPSTNKVSETFSEGSNKGLNFSGKIGEPVLAAAAGKVTLVTNSLRGYGNLIVIKHNTQYLSVYAHNSKMLVSEGQSIARGQKNRRDRQQRH